MIWNIFVLFALLGVICPSTGYPDYWYRGYNGNQFSLNCTDHPSDSLNSIGSIHG